jgi:hypothetical protein
VIHESVTEQLASDRALLEALGRLLECAGQGLREFVLVTADFTRNPAAATVIPERVSTSCSWRSKRAWVSTWAWKCSAGCSIDSA